MHPLAPGGAASYMRREMPRTLLFAAAMLAATSAAAAPRGVEVTGWARPTVAGQSSGAAYLVIRNHGPGADRIVSISTPAAGMTGVHRSQIVNGVARMRPAGAIVVPPGKMLTMGPNGLHVMLMGLKAPLNPGATLPLSVRFERAGTRQLRIPIQMSAPGDQSHRH